MGFFIDRRVTAEDQWGRWKRDGHCRADVLLAVDVDATTGALNDSLAFVQADTETRFLGCAEWV